MSFYFLEVATGTYPDRIRIAVLNILYDCVNSVRANCSAEFTRMA